MSRILWPFVKKDSILRAVLYGISLYLIMGYTIFALDTNDTSIPTENQTEPEEEFDVHVYVNNLDDDRLSVSLFIDSEIKDTEDVSSKSETKFGEYALTPEDHKFKIAWRDEDTKKNYEEELLQEINSSSSLILYTLKNDAPEKFDLSVKVENENDKSLDAFLYVDGGLEKSKELPKDSTADLGTISLEEGIHDLCLRWCDPETRIEYEKRKKVNIEGDDAVIFYAPKGVAFESLEEKTAGSSTGSSAGSSTGLSSAKTKTVTAGASVKSVSDDKVKPENNSEDSSKTKEDSKTEDKADDEIKAKAETKNSSLKNAASNESSIAAAAKAADTSGAVSKGIKLSKDDSKSVSQESSPDSPSDLSSQSPMKSSELSSLDAGNSLYLYAALVIIAIYLLFKH